jgi:V8-like Glu-specific endopeptidase
MANYIAQPRPRCSPGAVAATQQTQPCPSCRCPNDTLPFGNSDTGYYDAELQAYLEQPPRYVGRRLKYIFSPDARERVTATTTFPWRTIGQLDMQATNGVEYTCSGATVGSRAILTADTACTAAQAAQAGSTYSFRRGKPWFHITTYQAWTNSKDWR